MFKELSGPAISRKLHVNGGYYDNVRAVVRTISEVLAPAAVLAYEQLINKVQVVAKPEVSVSFYEKLSAILGMNPDKPHFVSNKSLITDITIELKDDQNREIPFS